MSKKHIICDSGDVSLKRIKNSFYGNPRYQVDFFNGVCVIHGVTMSDYSFCYELPYCGCVENVKVKYHYTAGGKVKFDYIGKEEE